MQLSRCCWLVCLLLMLCAHDAVAQSTREGSLANHASLYLDSDKTTIVTNATAVSARFEDRIQIGAHYLVDAVSSASVDVVTQATASMTDTRHDFGATAGYLDDEGKKLVAGYAFSTEHDWQSHNANLTGAVEVLERNLALGLNLGFQDNTITRADTFGFEETLQTYTVTGAGTYLTSPRDLVHLAVAVTHHDGYQASPYRFLTVGQYGYAETVPERRTRVAFVARYHRDLAAGLSLRTHARLYRDTYAVSSLTGGIELGYERRGFDALATVRAYSQTAASFYRSAYVEPQRYMTLDKELSPFWDVFAGAAGGFTWANLGAIEQARAELRVIGNHFRYLNFARLDQRYGITLNIGLSVLF